MLGEQTLGSMVVQITTDLENLNKGLKEAEKMVKNTSGKIMEWTDKVGKTLTIVGAGITATMGLTVKAASDAQLSWARSEQFIKNAGLAVDDVLPKIKDFASEMQSLTGQNDELIGLFASRLIPITKDVDKAFELTTAALDLSASGMIDLEGATRLFINAADGNIGRLGMLVPALKNVTDEQLKHLTQSQRLELILKAVNEQYGGQAKIVGQTLAGQMNKFKNTLGDLAELIGGYLLPIIIDFLKNKLIPLIERFKEFSEKHPELIKNIVLLTAAFGAFATALGPILIFLPQLVGAFATVKMAIITTHTTLGVFMSSLGVFLVQATTITAVIVALTAAIWELNKAMDARRGAQEAQKNELEAGLKFTEAISKNLEENLKTEKDLTDWQKIKAEGLKDNIENYRIYANSLLEKEKIDRRDIEAMREKLTHIIDESKALGDLAGQYIETSEIKVSAAQKDVETASIFAEIEKTIHDETTKELIQKVEEYYNEKLKLRELDLEEIISSIEQQLTIEQLSVEQRKALEENLAEFKRQKRAEEIKEASQTVSHISNTMSSQLASAIIGVQSFSDAWKNIWTNMAQYLIQKVLQKIIDKILEIAALKAVFAFIGLETGGLVSASGHKLPIPSAQQGLFIEGPPGPMPVLIHPPEVILPLEKFKKMQGSEVNINYYHYGDIRDEIDKEELISELGNRIKTILRES